MKGKNIVKLKELLNVYKDLEISAIYSIMNMKEDRKKLYIDEWELELSESGITVVADEYEIDKKLKPYLELEVVEYILEQRIEVMESRYCENETHIRKDNCKIIIEIAG